MSETDQLRALHEAYVWEVNAAVAEGRMDLVRQLSDEFTDEAMQLMTAQRSPGCDRPDCAVCAVRAPGSAPPTARRRRRWFWQRPRNVA